MKVGVIFYHSNITLVYPRTWISECVNSILNQTNQDFVIYELNYGDDEFRIHREYDIQNEYHYYKNKFTNHADAMNFLLQKCVEDGCEYVFNTNMDDVYSLDRIDTQLIQMKKGYDIVSSNFIHISESSEEVRKMNFSNFDIAKNLEDNHNIIAHPVVCYSRKFIIENSYRADEIPEEDLLLWKRTIDKYKFHICKEHLLKYRLHGNQTSSVKKKPKKVGLLIIATNKYVEFLDNLISTADKYFLPDQDVIYFIFTNKNINVESNRPYVNIHVDHKVWPWMTLGRFDIFTNHEKILSKMDYLYYCDVDMRFNSIVGDEILGELVATQHPGFYGERGSPETNIKSLAYVSPLEDMQYFAGGFNGGTSIEFLKMSKKLDMNIKNDYANGVIAVWHDESHLNRYLVDNNPTIVLNPSYCYSENMDIPFDQKLIALDKEHSLYRESHTPNTKKEKEKKKEEVIPDLFVSVAPVQLNKCSCGEPKNRVKFNFCQKCGKLY